MRGDGGMRIRDDGSRFPTTHWTVIGQVQPGDDAHSRFLIAELVRDYREPVCCYLCRKAYDKEDAKDLTQGCFQEVVLGCDVIPCADPRRGWFRALLLMAPGRYVADAHWQQTAQKRIPRDKLLPLDAADVDELPEVTPDLTCEESFNYAWISDLLDKVLEEVEADCRNRGMAVHWDLFHERVLRPIIEGKEPPALVGLCAMHGIDRPTNASNVIFAVKRRLQAALTRSVRHSVASEADMCEEMAELARFLTEQRQ